MLIQSRSESSRAKFRAATLSIGSNSVLIVLKVVAGAATGSVGILSDAIHSLMDLVASAVTLASVRKADQPADPTHRFGHDKFEDLGAIAQAALLLLGAAFVVVEAVRRLINPANVDSPGFVMAVAAVGALVNLGVSRYLGRVGIDTGSSALDANAADLHTDSVVSLGVLLSMVLFVITGARWIDPVVGLIVGLAISLTGIRILTAASRRLADEALPEEELEPLRRVVESFVGSEIIGFHDIRARHVGNRHQVDLHLQFVTGTSLERAHELAHQVEGAIISELPQTTVLVHMEPEDYVREDRFGEASA